MDSLREFTQREYSRLLEENHARSRGLSQGACERILMDHGASYQQAKNGAYVYLHHSQNTYPKSRATRQEYAELLDGICAKAKRQRECVEYLEGLGYTYGQAKSAVHRYRVDNNLIRKRR